MKKKSLLIRVLALVACISCAIGASAYDFVADNIYYTITGTNTVEVTYKNYYDSDGYSGDVSIPATVTRNGKTYNVTAIGELAFYSCPGMTSVTIPNTVTSIGSYAFFNCSGMTSITIPNSVTTIENAAFSKCSGLMLVSLPSSLTTIKNNTFYNCTSLLNVAIPNSVTSIESSAFSACTDLTAVVIGASVATIDSYAFNNCSNLEDVACLATTPPAIQSNTFPSAVFSNAVLTVPKGCMDAYQAASEWNRFTDVREVLYDFEVGGIYYKITDLNTAAVVYLFSDNNGSPVSCYSGNVTIPSTVTHGGNTYQVTAIGYCAFYNCPGLTKVTIPNSVNWIDIGAFMYCYGLVDINLPNSLTEIGDYAFSSCRGLKNITIPNSVTDVGENVFEYCTGLESASLSNSMTEISREMFIGCTSLKRVTIPNSVTEISYKAFGGCSSLTSVTIPASVEIILNCAFEQCPNLASVTCLATTPPVVYSATFDDEILPNCKLIVPNSALRAYFTADYWEVFINIHALSSDVNDDGIVNIADVADLINMLLNN